MNNAGDLDILREVVNIGVGEAANSLSQLLQKKVMLRVPDIQIMNVSEVKHYLQHELTSLGVYIAQDFEGMIKGKTILCYTRECSLSLLNAILGDSVNITSLTEIGISTLNEIGNIIMVSCMSEISNMIDGRISYQLPEVSIEVSEVYFRNMIQEISAFETAIVIKNEFIIHKTDIQGYMFILLSFEGYETVIDRLLKKTEVH
ncbi:MAG: hypothetical protein BWK80_51750 [Desulfobacteraceae bacterium IS3]|nr:MAG: hypothetical protein BWK80_51750 [Desulfobacteraceae bacterium IS3]HAO22587.1 hypothetical protein [Desulfobacteraceae bacterium]